MKRVLSFAAAVCLLLSLWGCSGSPSGKFAGVGKNTIEGPGFSSAEEAAEGYFKAWQSGDVSAILATYAVESYAENADLAGYISRVGVYLSSSAIRLPDGGDDSFTRSLNLYNRVGDISRKVLFGCRYLIGFPEDGMPQTFGDRSEAGQREFQAFLDRLSDPDFSRKLAGMKLKGVRTGWELDFGKGDKIQQTEEIMKSNYLSDLGCTEVAQYTLETEFDGRILYMAVTVGKLNGKWRVLDGNSSIFSMVGIPTTTGGMAFASDLDS